LTKRLPARELRSPMTTRWLHPCEFLINGEPTDNQLATGPRARFKQLSRPRVAPRIRLTLSTVSQRSRSCWKC
jgi:hypothetical protein